MVRGPSCLRPRRRKDEAAGTLARWALHHQVAHPMGACANQIGSCLPQGSLHRAGSAGVTIG